MEPILSIETLKVNSWSKVPKNFTGLVIFYNSSIGLNGTRWLQNGKFHRIDGPAIEYCNGIKQYWIHGQQIENENAYLLFVNMMKLKNL